MSGKKQHYIPQMFLQGFSFLSPSGKTKQVYVFRRAKVYPSNIDSVACENYFYSKKSGADEYSLDDKITDFESSKLIEALNTLHASSIDSDVESTIAAEVVSHLYVRQKFFKNAILHTFGTIMNTVFYLRIKNTDHIMEKAGIKFRFGIYYFSKDSLLWKIMLAEKNFWKRMRFRIFKWLYCAVSAKLLKKYCQNHTMEETNKNLSDFHKQFKDKIDDAFPQMMINHLEQQKEPLKWLEWKWKIIKAPECGLLLPDCIAICLNSKFETCPISYIPPDFNEQMAIMPLSDNTLLFGSRRDQQFPEKFDVNAAMASCAADFFISKTKSEYFENLTKNIADSYLKCITVTLTKGFEQAKANPKAMSAHPK